MSESVALYSQPSRNVPAPWYDVGTSGEGRGGEGEGGRLCLRPWLGSRQGRPSPSAPPSRGRVRITDIPCHAIPYHTIPTDVCATKRHHQHRRCRHNPTVAVYTYDNMVSTSGWFRVCGGDQCQGQCHAHYHTSGPQCMDVVGFVDMRERTAPLEDTAVIYRLSTTKYLYIPLTTCDRKPFIPYSYD